MRHHADTRIPWARLPAPFLRSALSGAEPGRPPPLASLAAELGHVARNQQGTTALLERPASA